MSEMRVRDLSIPALLVGAVLLAVSSGCLGLTEQSPEEVRDEFIDKFDNRHHFTVEVSDGWSDSFDAVVFEGTVTGGDSDFMSASGEYIERDSPGDEITRRNYGAVLRNGGLNVSIGGETDSIEGVDKDDLGEVYSVNLSNRSQWKFVSTEEELNRLLQSKPTGEKEEVAMYLKTVEEPVKTVKATRLQPEKDVVADLLNTQFQAPMGKQVLNLTADDIEHVEVHLVKEDSPLPKYMIQIKGETKQGHQFLNTIRR